MPRITAILSFSHNRPGRAFLCSTTSCGFFSFHDPLRCSPTLSTIDANLFTLQLNFFLSIELSSVEAALNPVLLIQLTWIDRLRIRLGIAHTAHQYARPTACDEQTLHQTLLARLDLLLAGMNYQRAYHYRRYAVAHLNSKFQVSRETFQVVQNRQI